MPEVNYSAYSSMLQKYLAEIGRSGPTAYPWGKRRSQDPADQHLHVLHVDKLAESFFKKQRERTWAFIYAKVLNDERRTKLELMLNQAREAVEKQELNLLVTPNFTLHVEVRKPVHAFKLDKLKTVLAKRGWSLKDISQLIDESSEYSKPAEVISSVPSSNT